MSLVNITDEISTIVNVDPEIDTYIINLQPSTTATYNLPQITSDGTNFYFVRIDNEPKGVLFNAFTGDSIVLSNGSSVTSYILKNFSALYIYSLDKKWYFSYRNSVILKNKPFFTSSFLASNNSEFIVYRSSSKYQIICGFPYPGAKSGITLSNVIISTTKSSGNPPLNWVDGIRLYDAINLNVLVERTSLTLPALSIVSTPNISYWELDISPSEFVNFPSETTLITLEAIINTTGAGVYFVSVY